MKIVLEIHRYAPELNKVYVGRARVVMPAPGCTTIKEARSKLFAPLKYTGRHVVLSAINTPDKESYNRTRSGFCNDMRSLSGAIKAFKAYHNLPGCKHVVKTSLIG